MAYASPCGPAHAALRFLLLSPESALVGLEHSSLDLDLLGPAILFSTSCDCGPVEHLIRILSTALLSEVSPAVPHGTPL